MAGATEQVGAGTPDLVDPGPVSRRTGIPLPVVMSATALGLCVMGVVLGLLDSHRDALQTSLLMKTTLRSAAIGIIVIVQVAAARRVPRRWLRQTVMWAGALLTVIVALLPTNR
jgi:hypothetical protein